MEFMFVTAAVLKFDTLWLNAVQPASIEFILVTAAVLKFDTLLLNVEQPWNMYPMFVTAAGGVGTVAFIFDADRNAPSNDTSPVFPQDRHCVSLTFFALSALNPK